MGTSCADMRSMLAAAVLTIVGMAVAFGIAGIAMKIVFRVLLRGRPLAVPGVHGQ